MSIAGSILCADDAEIRKLKKRIKQLEAENKRLREDITKALDRLHRSYGTRGVSISIAEDILERALSGGKDS